MSMYAYWLANTGLTVHKLTGLMTEGIGAEELYALQESQMKKIRVLDEKDVEKITQSRRHWDVQEHWGKLQGEGIGFVCVEDARYPQKLRRISATPYALYYIGRLPEETRKSVAIVGARTRSAYGSQITGKLARALAQNRMDIISGMAMGIDADAHSGALEENGDTYAVLGCGLIRDGIILNDETLPLLAHTAVSYARTITRTGSTKWELRIRGKQSTNTVTPCIIRSQPTSSRCRTRMNMMTVPWYSSRVSSRPAITIPG